MTTSAVTSYLRLRTASQKALEQSVLLYIDGSHTAAMTAHFDLLRLDDEANDALEKMTESEKDTLFTLVFNVCPPICK